MTDHIYLSILNALADGELSPGQLAATNQHLVGCPLCFIKACSNLLRRRRDIVTHHRQT